MMSVVPWLILLGGVLLERERLCWDSTVFFAGDL